MIAALAIGVGLFFLLSKRRATGLRSCRETSPIVGAHSRFRVQGSALIYAGTARSIWVTQGPIQHRVQLPEDIAFLVLLAPTSCDQRPEQQQQQLLRTLSELIGTPALIVPGPCDNIEWLQSFVASHDDAAFAVATGVDRLRFFESSIALNSGAPSMYAQEGACVSVAESSPHDQAAVVAWMQPRVSHVATFAAWPRDVVPFFEPCDEVSLDGPVPTGIFLWQVSPYQRSLVSRATLNASGFHN